MASLIEQNHFLRDPQQRDRLLRNSAATSSAVEGIRKPYADRTDKDGQASNAVSQTRQQPPESA